MMHGQPNIYLKKILINKNLLKNIGSLKIPCGVQCKLQLSFLVSESVMYVQMIQWSWKCQYVLMWKHTMFSCSKYFAIYQHFMESVNLKIIKVLLIKGICFIQVKKLKVVYNVLTSLMETIQHTVNLPLWKGKMFWWVFTVVQSVVIYLSHNCLS